jgi:drug/metabolite transporter (DMT)-like permease
MNITRNSGPGVPLPVLLVIGIIAISFSSIFVRWSSAPVSIIAMYRLVLTNVCMLPFLIVHRREIVRIEPIHWGKLIVSGVALGLHFLFWMGSLRFTSVASSTAILTLEPIFVLLGSFWLFKQRTSRVALISMIIAILGAILIGWGDFRFSGIALQGDLLSLLGALTVAFHMLIGKSLRATMSAFVYSFWVFLFAAAVLAVYNVCADYSFTAYSLKEWGIFLLLAIVPTVLGHYLFNWLLKYMKATSVSMTVLGEPLGATILAYYLLGEMITPLQIAAGCVLLIGVALFIRSNESMPSK